MGSVKTNHRRSSYGIVGNDRSTTVKGHIWKRSLNDGKIASSETIFRRSIKRLNCRKQGLLETLAQQSYEGIIDHYRLCAIAKSYFKNNRMTGSLKTIFQQAQKEIIENDGSSMLKSDRWNSQKRWSLNDFEQGTLKPLIQRL